MTLLSPEQERYHILRRSQEDLAEVERRLLERIERLESIEIDTTIAYSPPNYLPNSHPEWSYAAYIGTTPGAVTPSTAGDGNRECYNWVRQKSPFDASPANVTALGSPPNSTALKRDYGTATAEDADGTASTTTVTTTAAFFDSGYSYPADFVLFGAGTAGVPLTGTLTRVSDTQATLSATIQTTVADTTIIIDTGSAHSTYMANEAADVDIPIWDGVNGNILMGGSSDIYDVAAPLTSDMVNPGQEYYVTMEIQTTVTAKAAGQRAYCGFWDKTNNDWIKGGTFTPTLSVYGAPGSRTLAYKVYAATDSGEEIISAEVSTSVAPATLTPQDHVRLSFSGAPGFTRYDIYRKDGSNYYRVGSIRNSIDLQFFDAVETGDTVVEVSGYPTPSETAPAAYAQSATFSPADSGAFRTHTFRIRVPTTYDRSSVAAGDQWFRFGLTQRVSGGNERTAVFRRIGVSEGYGSWTRSPKDLQVVNQPTGTSTSSPPPSYPIPVPPPRGGGGPSCVTLDTEVETLNHLYETILRPIRLIKKGMYLSCGPMSLPVKGLKEGEAAFILHITLQNGLELKCSETHRLIRSQMDTVGKAAGDLKEGEKLLSCLNGKFTQSVIKSIVQIPGPIPVKTVVLPSPHLFITNGFVSHNSKPEEPTE